MGGKGYDFAETKLLFNMKLLNNSNNAAEHKGPIYNYNNKGKYKHSQCSYLLETILLGILRILNDLYLSIRTWPFLKPLTVYITHFSVKSP